MVFSDLFFIFVFLPVFLLCYMSAWLIDKKWLGTEEQPATGARNAVLVTFSLIFYAWGEPRYVFLLMFMALVDWFCALRIDASRTW